jgi:hypothetical protein
VYERIVRRALRYGIQVTYQSDLAEAKPLPESVKNQLEGCESADSLIAKANALVEQLKVVP